jgi:hypothetical protein
MASIISAGTTSGTALNLSGDTTGNLAFTTQAGANTITVPNVTGTLLTNKTAGTILQVVQTVKTDTFSVTGGLTNDITGMSVSITPSSSTNKILVQVVVYAQNSGESGSFLTLVRGSTAICIGNAAGSRSRASTGASYDPTGYQATSLVVNFLDSPATTSSTTYKCQIAANSTSTTYVNRTFQDNDVAQIGRYVSTITVMEVVA